MVIANLFSRHRWTILGAIFFLTVQWVYSFVLLNRNGDLAVNPDDSYSYIFAIKKVPLFKSFFPAIPSFNINNNFVYLGYSLLFGGISWLFDIGAEILFFSSFFWGKSVLLLVLIYLLSSLGFSDIKKSVSLIFLGLFSGNGAIHGFFWVAPSFWWLVITFLLLGMYFDKRKLNHILVLFLTLFYVTIHPLALPSSVFWAILLLMTWYSGRLFKYPQANKIVVSIIVFNLLYLAFQRLFAEIFPSPMEFVIDDHRQVLDTTFLPKVDRVLYLIPPAVGKMNILGISAIDLLDFTKFINLLSGYFPSFSGYWQILISPLLTAYPLAIPLMLAVWITLSGNKINKEHQLLLKASGAWSLLFIVHFYGYRTLLLFMPLVYLTLGVVFFNLLRMVPTDKVYKLVRLVLIISIVALSTYLLRLNLLTIEDMARNNESELYPEKCVSYLSDQQNGKWNQIFTTSQTIFNAALANGLHDKKLAPYLSESSVEIYITRKIPIYIIQEAKAFEGSSDTPFASESIDRLDFLKNQGWLKKKVDCGYFNIVSYKPQT